MKKLHLLAIATAFSLSICTAHADSFTFSYTWDVGGVNENQVSGSFDGTPDGNQIHTLSNIWLFFDGTPASSNPMVNTGYSVADGWVLGAAVASFDGTANNFNFSSPDSPVYFYSIHAPGGMTARYRGGMDFKLDMPTIYSNWSVSSAYYSHHDVPEITHTSALLVMSLLGLVAWNRRQSTLNAQASE